jgi:hypothetical protein
VQHKLQVLVLPASLLQHPSAHLVAFLVEAELELTTTALAAVAVGTVAEVLNGTLAAAADLVMLEELQQQL